VKHASAYRTFLALVASLAWSSALLAEQNVTFTTDVNFTIRPSASGIVSRSRDSLSLLLYDVTLVSQDPTSATPRSCRVGIAYGDPSTGRWNVSHWSPHIDINAPFDLTGTLEVKRVGLSIPTASSSLKGRWLVIEVRYVSHRLNGVIASSYAHSSRAIFDGQDY
jgi:hypothetical protein